jgi:uncharacterized protein
MDTKQKLESALHEAMRSHNDEEKRTIRLALSSIKFEEVNTGKPLDDTAQISILQKEIKMRHESIEGAEKANRPDLVEENQVEIRILETFLPKQFTEDELRALTQEAITEIGAASPNDMGKVMKILLPKVQGRAPNNMVSQMVRKLLGS